MVSLLLIFDIMVAKNRVYGKQALQATKVACPWSSQFFVNPYVS